MSVSNWDSHGDPRPIEPESRSFFASATTRATFDHLLAGLHERRGLALVVGEAGTGKTTLLSKLRADLEAVGCLVVVPGQRASSFDDLLEACCDAAGVGDGIEDRMGRLRALTEILVERLDQGTTAAVLIDDAQFLAVDVLEDFARLTAIEKGQRKLVQLVVCGGPELVARLCASDYRPLQDSAIEHLRLERLNGQDVEAYIRHYINDAIHSAGETDPKPFSPEAVARIARISNGVPRRINRICALCLASAGREGETTVSAATVTAAARELTADQGRSAAETPADPSPPDRFDEPVAGPGPAETVPDEAAPPVMAPPTRTASETPEAADIPVEIPDPPVQQDDAPAPVDPAPDIRESAEPVAAPVPDRLVVSAARARPRRRLARPMPIAAALLVGLALGATALLLDRSSDWWPASDGEQAAPPAKLADAAPPEPVPTPASPRKSADTRKPATVRIARFRGASGAVLQVMDNEGKEDQALRLDVRAQLPVDNTVGGLSVVISDMPEGALLLAGTDHGDGTWSVGPKQLSDLTFIPPMDYSGRFQLTIKGILGPAGAKQATATLPLNVSLAGVADLPSLEVSDSGSAGDAPIPLDIEAALVDVDGSERLSIMVSGLPEGGRLTAGDQLGNGRWRLGPDQLADLSFIPPAGFGGSTELLISATARETGGDSATSNLPLAITAGAKIARAKQPAAKTPAAKPAAAKLAPTKLTTAKQPAAKLAAVKRPAAPAAGGKDDFVLQLASFRSAGDASKEVARLESRFADLLGSSKLEVQEAETDTGAYFRVRTMPLDGWTKAFDLCTRFKAVDQDCLVFQQGPATGLTKLPPGDLTPKDPPPKLPTSLVATAMPTAAAAPSADLRVVDFVVARDVVDREPSDITASFSLADGDAYAYARIANDGAPAPLSFVWLHREAIYASVEMTIGTSPRWRTWSSAELQPGPWRVQLVSADGLVIAETDFTVD